MDGQIVNISLPSKLLKLADRVAEKEARSRSELFREAIRNYVLRRARWDELFNYAEKKARRLGIKEKYIEKIVKDYRSSRNKS
ncbi:ribbon-helix-helix protein, CopG family [Candidatus Gottesmanbacteria bacterium]|nr:ribbon-helix-helix protein, CopG family [Candidatus Gottesmanbacteria bacterium]